MNNEDQNNLKKQSNYQTPSKLPNDMLELVSGHKNIKTNTVSDKKGLPRGTFINIPVEPLNVNNKINNGVNSTTNNNVNISYNSNKSNNIFINEMTPKKRNINTLNDLNNNNTNNNTSVKTPNLSLIIDPFGTGNTTKKINNNFKENNSNTPSGMFINSGLINNNENNNIPNQKVEKNISKANSAQELKEATKGLEPIKNDEPTFKKMNIEDLMRNVSIPKLELEVKTKKENKWFLYLAVGSGFLFAVVLMIAIFGSGISISFGGKSANYENKKANAVDGGTVVVTDNMYTGVTVKSEDDARKLIVKDSDNQKAKCSDTRVKEVESRIEQNYKITAVNLCEMDYNLALEIEKTIKRVYKEFPGLEGYITNLTLNNMKAESTIASFSSAKVFAKSGTFTTYPHVYKMSIFLNSSYFLNIPTFDAEIENMVSSEYFPPNANKASVFSHELGHYISFIAHLNYTKEINKLLLLNMDNRKAYKDIITLYNDGDFSMKMIQEAFENYKKKNPNGYSDVYSFRASISGYASTDVYDETIAEAFHDCYLNGNNAKEASQEILKVLKKYFTK